METFGRSIEGHKAAQEQLKEDLDEFRFSKKLQEGEWANTQRTLGKWITRRRYEVGILW